MNKEFLFKNRKLPKALIVSSDIYSESEKTLKKLGVEIIYSFENTNVHSALAKHADMQIVALGDNKYICAPETYDYYKDVLKKFDVELKKGDTYLSSNYPGDIAYNIIVTGKYAIHNFKYTDSVLAGNITDLKHINVSQGYCGCTICKIKDGAFITADCGVEKALIENGFDVLHISGKDILLPGFNEGFIGGCSFKILPDVLCVNGDIQTNADYDLIIDFCNCHGVTLLSLSDNPVMDIGSGVCVY